MFNDATNISARELLDSLTRANLVDDASGKPLEDGMLAYQQEKADETPIYVQVLIGIGSLLASLCVIGVLFAADILEFRSDTTVFVVWGLGFIGAALFLNRASKSTKHVFITQISFCAMLAGKILFVFGAVDLLVKDLWGIALAMLAITLLTYPLYRVPLDRFLSPFATFATILFCILDQQNYFDAPVLGGAAAVMLDVFCLVQVALAAFLLTGTNVKRDYIPLAYAAVFSLCLTVTCYAAGSEFLMGGRVPAADPSFINALLTVALIGLIGWVAGDLEKLKTPPLMLAMGGVLLLGAVSAPGVILAISLLVLGYARHEKLLSLVGALLLPVFIVQFYYNLETSLLVKSGILLASGAVLLAGHFYLAFKKWDRA